MEKHYYTCLYCSKKYLPRRRYKQKFCSNSCRVNSHNRHKKLQLNRTTKGLKVPSEKEQKDGITWGGIGNATIANIATEVGKSIFTKNENKPATKGDIQAIMNVSQQRYFPVHNAPKANDGTSAYYDTKTKTVVYLKNQFPC
jgi:hypothetical protein